MTLTVFQALTLLMKKYRLDPPMYKRIKSIYLSGVKNEEDEASLQALLQDELFIDVVVSGDKESVTMDPVRRYFESHLCCETIIHNIDSLEIRQLNDHFDAVFNLLSEDDRELISDTILQGKCESREHYLRYGEYIEAIRHLALGDSYSFLKPKVRGHKLSFSAQLLQQRTWQERKTKLLLLMQCIVTGMLHVHHQPEDALPLSIYFMNNSPFSEENRGRMMVSDSVTGDLQAVFPRTLGIMRSYMPLAVNDPLLADDSAEYQRPADVSTYKKGSFLTSDKLFATQVTPLVNSISGVMLCQLRIIATLHRQQRFIYEALRGDPHVPQQFHYFLKLVIAYLLFHSGGHSLYEYMMVLELPDVQKEFRDFPTFSSLTLDKLFRDDNELAFEQAVNLVIQYNEHYLTKQQLHHELFSPSIRARFFNSRKSDQSQLLTAKVNKCPQSR